MIRVLQIFSGLGRGGLETFVMNVYRTIDRTKVQFDFLLSTPNGDYEEEARNLGANIYYVPSRSKGVKKYNEELDKFFKENGKRYSAVHLHVPTLSSVEPLFYAKKYGIGTRIIHSHSSSVKKNLRFRFLHLLVHHINKFRIKSLATNYLGCSDKALDWMYKYSGVRDKAVLIQNGIEPSKFIFNPAVRTKIREEFQLNDEFVIGHVGSFIPVKNHKFLINLFFEYQKKHGNTKLLLVGDGSLRSDIETQIKELGIEGNVILAGIRSDVNEILQAMDVFVMPSFFEGLPVVLVEAQASGLPIICSDKISKMSKMSENFLMLSISESPQVWASAINKTPRNINRNKAYENIIKHGYDINSIATELCKTYAGQNTI